jgi:hypothetical protein
MKVAAALVVSLVLGCVASARAAVVTVTDCTAPPVEAHGGTTRIEIGADDLVLACALQPLPGTAKVRIRANRVTIQGPTGGISAPGKGNAVDVRAAADIVVQSAALEAGNGNGAIRLRAITGLDVENAVLTTGGADKGGRQIQLQCTGDDCPLVLEKSNLVGRNIKVRVKGPITSILNTVVTRGPRDLIDVRTANGSALLCCDTWDGKQEAVARVQAAGDVDLQQSSIVVGEDIWVTSGTSGAGDTNLFQARLDNDFGKKGEITVSAAKGAGQVNIDQATLVDDDVRKPDDVSKINGRETLPHQGFVNIVGTPDVDM